MGRKAMIGFMIAILLLAVTFVSEAPDKQVSAAGNTYYVDGVNGSDTTGNGSSGNPWRTIGKAASLMTAGDTAKIRSGVYRETVKPANSGTAGNPITFEPDTGADVTVSGADVVSGPWTVHSGNIYKTNATLQMGDFLDQVYVDGVSNNLARSPNSAITNIYDPALYQYDPSSTRGQLVDSDLTQPNGYWDNAALFVEDSGEWNFSSALVTTSTTGSLQLKTWQSAYSLKLSAYDNTLKLINHNGSVLGTYNVTVAQNTTYNLKVSVAGSAINVYFNNGSTPVITATDSTLKEGSFGLGLESDNSSVAATAEFTNVNAVITSQDPNQATGRENATFASNIQGWAAPEATGYWRTNGTTLYGYTQPQTAGAGATYESSTTAKDFTYSADVKLTSAGAVSMTFRKEAVPGNVIDLSDWGYGASDYFIMGKLAALDYPGEWYYDKGAGVLYLQTTTNSNPASHTVEVKARNLAFDLTGKSNIAINKLKLFAATIDMANGSNNIIDGINAKYVSQFNKGISYSAGICLCGTNNTLKNSELQYSSGALVTIKGESNKLINNLIHDGTYGPIVFNSVIDIFGVGHLISHNTAYNSGRSLIGGDFYAAVIQYNDFHHGNYFAKDTAMLYTAHNDLGNSEIHHNYWHDNVFRSDGSGEWTGGIYLDESSANALIYNNVTWNLSWMGIIVNHLSNFVMVYNNTTHNESGIRISEPTYGLDAYGDRIINNIAFDELGTGASTIGAVFSNNMTSGSPMYVNPTAADFRLQSGSGAIDIGTPIPGITDGFTGSAPDVGAYEYGGASWTAGHNFVSPPNPTYQLIDTDYKNLIVNGTLDLNRMHHPGMDSLYGWTKTHSQTAQPAFDHRGEEVSSRFYYETGVSLGTGEDGIEQTITGLTPNTTYEIKGYLRAHSSGQTIRLGVKNYGGANIYEEHTATSWAGKTFTFTTGATDTSATIYAYKPTTGGYAWIDDIMVSSKGAAGAAVNLALNKSVTASSIYGAGYEAGKAVDGNSATRWSSAVADPSWIYVDLGATERIGRVKLNWDPAYASSYKIQVSTDATNWTDVYSTTTGDGGIDDITFAPVDARYVRMYGTVRASFYGYSLWDFEVYSPVDLAKNKSVTASSIYGAGYEAGKAVDGNSATRWSSAVADPSWIYVDLGSTQSVGRVRLSWDPAYATSYQIQVSTDATNWTNVYSTTTGDGGIDDIAFAPVDARYVRMYGTVRASFYGYSLWDFEVYNG